MSTFFSQNLRFLRSKMSEKTSQEKLAELLHIKKPTLGSYESGRAEPKYADLIALAEFFQVEVDELLKEDLAKHIPGLAITFLKATDVNHAAHMATMPHSGQKCEKMNP